MNPAENIVYLTDGEQEAILSGKPAPKADHWPDGFSLRSDGLNHATDPDASGTRLTGPFEVAGLARADSGHGHAVAIRWHDADGRAHTARLRRGDMIGESLDTFRDLADRGLWINGKPMALAKLREAFSGLQPAARVIVIDRTGWHGQSFVLPHETIGGDEGENVLFDGNVSGARFATRGTLDDWRQTVAAPAGGNSRLALALSVAFAGPVLDAIEGEGGGFHLVGGSSLGKSTALVMAGSVWGGGGPLGFCQTWRATGNALESLAKAHSGTLLCLDEIGEMNGREAGEISYMLSQGQGKARAGRTGEARARSTWRVVVLSSGEMTLADKAREGGRVVKAGQAVRFVDVPADAGSALGLFDDCGEIAPADFAAVLKRAAMTHFGTAGPAFVEHLASVAPDRLRSAIRKKTDAARIALLEGIAHPDGQTIRVADRFALVAVAGEMAHRALDLPWPDNAALSAAKTCFDAWRGQRGGEGPAEIITGLGAIREAIERHGESRFIREGTTPATRDVLGYRLDRPEGLLWAFTASGWKEALSGIADPAMIARALAERGAMASTVSDRAHRLIVKRDGRTMALYAVRQSFLEADSEVAP
jgi:putative DNA primase/helicase